MFKYYLLKVLRSKTYLFWCLVFPLGIMACMNVAFGSIYSIENSIDPVKTSLVMESEGMYAKGFESMIGLFADKDSENYFFDNGELALTITYYPCNSLHAATPDSAE